MTSAITDLISGLSTSVAVKPPCRAATTANIVLNGLQTIDGVALAANDRVLVKDQTDQTKNGVYIADTSTWQRAKDFDGKRDVAKGTLVKVNAGTLGEGFWYLGTDDPITVGDSNLTFTRSSVSPFIVVTGFGQSLVDDVDEAAGRATLQLGSMATQNSSSVNISGGSITSTAGTIQSMSIAGSSINNTPIGTSTPSSADFTTIALSSVLDLSSTNAGQVKFSSPQNPSTNQNILDGYLENDGFTPAFTFGGSTAGWTGSSTGNNIKIGRFVHANVSVTINATGTSTGQLSVALPHPIFSLIGGGVTHWAEISPAVLRMDVGLSGSQLFFKALSSATSSYSALNVDGGFFKANSQIRFFLEYMSSS